MARFPQLIPTPTPPHPPCDSLMIPVAAEPITWRECPERRRKNNRRMHKSPRPRYAFKMQRRDSSAPEVAGRQLTPKGQSSLAV